MADISVEYIDHMGNDLTVVNAARVSFDKESGYQFFDNGLQVKGFIQEKDRKLLAYLSEHNHWSPFAHCMITLRETVPIFVARQRFKHMVGFTYNEVSRRYVDSPPEFYIPDVWRSRPEASVKQGSGKTEVTNLNRGSVEYEWDESPQEAYHDHLTDSLELYNDMLSNGVAPEMARMVLPQSMMTSYYVTGSLAAFARAYKQRIDGHSQLEIQMLAQKWDEIIRPLYPHAWKGMVDER